MLEITTAKGEFVLQENQDLEVCFIATGTGIAPFRPMIEQLLSNTQKNVFLIYGNRKKEDILYHQEWLDLEQEYANFKYIPVLSKENWDGKLGYVHAIYQTIFADGRNAQFYICGWSEMIKEARNNLKALGYNRKQYFIEAYN